MRMRSFGATGVEVSELGYGAWGIGKGLWAGAEDAASIQAVQRSCRLGINFFDTALAYGEGESERILSRGLNGHRDALIASKVPPKDRAWPPKPGTPYRQVFPRNYVRTCLEATLANLERSSLDLYQFHVWNDEWATDAHWLEDMRELRKSGKVRWMGISVNDHQTENVLRGLETGLVEVVQVIYNIFDQTAEENLFPYCAKHNIAVIARCPFDEGSLTGHVRPETVFARGEFRERYFAGDRKKQVWDHVERLTQDLGIHVDELPAIALRFCLTHSAVSTVIAGMRTAAHVEANAAAAAAGPLPEKSLDVLRRHRWDKNFYS